MNFTRNHNVLLSAVTYSIDNHRETASQLGVVKLTKCVTIRSECENLSEHQPLSPRIWLNCFDVTSQTRQALKNTSDWESADTSHVLLDIVLSDQQLSLLPLLITPVHCIYLIMFDLRTHQESLSRIHKAMKNVFAFTSYQAKAGAQKESPPRVLLVGMYADDEHANRKSFAEKLRKLLQKMPYNRLVCKPSKPDESFWAVSGGDLSLSGTDPLSCAIQSSYSSHEGEVRQWIKCHKELQEKLMGVPCILYSHLKEHVAGKESGVEMSRFDDFLQFLHGYNFIFYHSNEEGQDTDKVSCCSLITCACSLLRCWNSRSADRALPLPTSCQAFLHSWKLVRSSGFSVSASIWALCSR